MKKLEHWTGRVAIAILVLATMSSSNAGWFKDLTGIDTPEPLRNFEREVLRPVGGEIDKNLDKTWNSGGKFLDDPLGYALELPGKIIADVCSAPIRGYEQGLRIQANGRWKSLPPQLIQGLQQQYGVNLHGVRYAEGIATSNGAAQTIGSSIYFPTHLNLYDRGHLYWMLHELEHTVQFARGGTSSKLCEYVAKAIGNGFDHDRIDMERAADRKAEFLINHALRLMHGAVSPASGSSVGQDLAPNEIFISNDLGYPVRFTLATATIAPTVMTLAPFASSIYTGSSGDAWFNITIESMGRVVQYGLGAKTRQHLSWNAGRGLIDVFHEP